MNCLKNSTLANYSSIFGYKFESQISRHFIIPKQEISYKKLNFERYMGIPVDIVILFFKKKPVRTDQVEWQKHTLWRNKVYSFPLQGTEENLAKMCAKLLRGHP